MRTRRGYAAAALCTVFRNDAAGHAHRTGEQTDAAAVRRRIAAVTCVIYRLVQEDAAAGHLDIALGRQYAAADLRGIVIHSGRVRQIVSTA